MAGFGIRDGRSRPHAITYSDLRPTATWRMTLTLIVSYAAVWLLQRRYAALNDDAHLYALQALGRLHPDLFATDIFLRFGSQDHFTVFTGAYAWLIGRVGVPHAAAILTVLSHIVFLAGVWLLARPLIGARLAWLALGLVMVMSGIYGAGQVFEYCEQFLTARIAAEALVLLALAAFLAGQRILGAALAVGAALCHPIMAMPGILLSVLLLTKDRHLPHAIVLGLVGVGLIVLIATFHPVGSIGVTAPDWLEVIKTRSWFLFPTRWPLADWLSTLVPLFSLQFSYLVLPIGLARKLAVRAAIVGAGGLLLATLAGDMVPVQVVLQGQAWRWIWIAKVVALILLPATVCHAWAPSTAQRATVTLIIAAWVTEPVGGGLIAAIAAALWMLRRRIDQDYRRYALGLVAGVAAVSCAWSIASAYTVLSTEFTANRESLVIEKMQNLLSLAVPAAIIVTGIWFAAVHRSRTGIAAVVLVAAVIAIGIRAPRVREEWTQSMYSAEIREAFVDWRELIPPRAEVLWLEVPVATWLLLERPNFISRSQSAGVVFSRDTALAVKERVVALRSLVDEEWLLAVWSDTDSKRRLVRPLTIARLRDICAHPELAFVVSRDDIGLPALVHASTPQWTGNRLYSCAQVR